MNFVGQFDIEGRYAGRGDKERVRAGVYALSGWHTRKPEETRWNPTMSRAFCTRAAGVAARTFFFCNEA